MLDVSKKFQPFYHEFVSCCFLIWWQRQDIWRVSKYFKTQIQIWKTAYVHTLCAPERRFVLCIYLVPARHTSVISSFCLTFDHKCKWNIKSPDAQFDASLNNEHQSVSNFLVCPVLAQVFSHLFPAHPLILKQSLM